MARAREIFAFVGRKANRVAAAEKHGAAQDALLKVT
jgi:hypothetical protein